MAPTISSPTRYLPLPDKVLSQIADLARVPQKARKEFLDFIVTDVLDLHAISERHHNEEAVSDAVKAAHKLHRKIAGLHPRDRERLVDQSFEDEINRFLELAEGDYKRFYRKEFYLRASRQKQVKRRGRKKGEFTNPRLRQLVLGLRYISARKGRQFTFDKNSEKGTLTKALKLLRPYAPAGVVPQVLPRSTIETWIVKDNERNAVDRASMEKKLLQIIDPEAARTTLERLMGPAKSRAKIRIQKPDN